MSGLIRGSRFDACGQRWEALSTPYQAGGSVGLVVKAMRAPADLLARWDYDARPQQVQITAQTSPVKVRRPRLPI